MKWARLSLGVVGLNAALCKAYMHFISNRRCAKIRLAPVFPDAENPFPWISEAMDLEKEKKFFEIQVVSVRSSASQRPNSRKRWASH
jgi:ribonucleoside-diphosphate reductase beta chain